MRNAYYDFLNDRLINILYTFKILLNPFYSEIPAPVVSAELPVTSRALPKAHNPLNCSTPTVSF